MNKRDLAKWAKYFAAREAGLSPEQAAKKGPIASSTAYRFERGDQTSTGIEAASILGINMIAGSAINQPLSAEAQQALEDFAYFRLRYFGRKSAPWQERAAYDCIRQLQTPDREYIVINCPPGSGKSTLFTHDIPCWLIARDRTIRIQLGARTERQARMYAGRIKKSLEREAPMRASSDALIEGIAFDAVAVMADDFGAFKPEGRSELWRAESMTVRQLDGVSLDDKEPTVSAWGQDSGFLGGRFDFVVWDDLVDSKNTKGEESKEKLEEWWSTEAETRLEPGGVLLLQGQRIAYNDLYKWCLKQQNLDDTPKYRHIIYKAHDEPNCRGHDDDVTNRPAAWPEGCLLDPWRLPMKFLDTIKHNNARTFEVQYQQEDGDLVAGLVQPAWIKGGLDDDGFPRPGCLDLERTIGDVPVHLSEIDSWSWSFVTVDPSPDNWWGIIWWVYDPISGNRYAIDLIRRKMNPEDFLSLDLDTGVYSGLCVELVGRAQAARVPINNIFVETNAAQKWLLGQPHVQRWMQNTGVRFIPHTTHLNKLDPKYGLESIGDLFRQGKIRLPYATPTARMKTATLTSEALAYPDSDTTDMIMSTWFAKLAVENHYVPRVAFGYASDTMPWMADMPRGLAAYR